MSLKQDLIKVKEMIDVYNNSRFTVNNRQNFEREFNSNDYDKDFLKELENTLNINNFLYQYKISLSERYNEIRVIINDSKMGSLVDIEMIHFLSSVDLLNKAKESEYYRTIHPLHRLINQMLIEEEIELEKEIINSNINNEEDIIKSKKRL